jgi:uncharacterized protein
MNSCLYNGWVRHRRRAPTENRFTYRMFMVYLDLEELPDLFRGVPFWSSRRPALAWFKRGDYLGSADTPLDESVRDLVASRLQRRPAGPIRLLTHLRYFGYCFNPVSFYYCFDAAGERVETIVAEITNTPWGERHQYVLDVREIRGQMNRFQFDKRFHVSPFMPMNMQYDWRFNDPASRLLVHMENFRDGEAVFDATLVLKRQAMSAGSLLWALVSYPLLTLKVVAAIHWQALRLWLKRTPFHPHPAASR